ncbi:MAG: response regulator [Cyclobacteriaceae bacterium]
MVSNNDISILYVDDEEPNLFLFKVTFEDKYHVITSSSGEEGLEKLKEAHSKIIVVISDMSMPKMNGVEFIREARELYKSIGYFILTGYNYNDEIDQAIKENVVHKFFTKPFDPEKIEEAIEEFRASGLVSNQS